MRKRRPSFLSRANRHSGGFLMPQLLNQMLLADKLEHVADFKIKDFETHEDPTKVLMCPATFFTVESVQNPFMEGKVGTVDVELAKKQWQALKDAYESLGCEVKTIEPVEGLEDMVFAANQVLPGMDRDGKPFVVLGEMRSEKRNQEVPWYRKWFQENNYHIIDIFDSKDNKKHSPCFEGQGDAIWHPGRRLLWCAYGPRTDKEAATLLSMTLGCPIIQLRLADPRFYHLDTCFLAINESTVAIYEGAFDEDGLALIKHMFSVVISVSEREALNFALNAVAIKDSIILQKGSPDFVAALKRHGFKSVEVDTGEFMKSGGSVFCMKMMVY